MSSDGEVPRLRAILWDIDGTLIDTTRLIVAALDHIYREHAGRSLPPDQIRGLIGIPLREQVSIFGPPEQFGSATAKMEHEFIRYYEANRHQERIIFEAVEALILGKRGGLATGVVTSKNAEELSNTLPRLGIAPYLDCIISADDVRNPKPDPEGVLAALTRLGTRPDEVVFVGDTVHDLRAGKAAGVRRCAVSWGAATRANLLLEEPELFCNAPGELAATLGIRSGPTSPGLRPE